MSATRGEGEKFLAYLKDQFPGQAITAEDDSAGPLLDLFEGGVLALDYSGEECGALPTFGWGPRFTEAAADGAMVTLFSFLDLVADKAGDSQ